MTRETVEENVTALFSLYSLTQSRSHAKGARGGTPPLLNHCAPADYKVKQVTVSRLTQFVQFYHFVH